MPVAASFRPPLVPGLLAALLIGCGRDSLPPPTSVGGFDAGSVEAAPFQARYVWRIVSQAPSPGCDGPGEARSFLEGVGNGTQLGRFTITLNHCGRPGLPLSDGHGTFVAANGDLLHITYFGVGGLTGAPPIFNFESSVTFVGGTGRFVGASGGATVRGTIDVRVLAGTGDWDGHISKPAD